MERIEDLMKGPRTDYGSYGGMLPALPEPMYTLPALLADAWAVLRRKATAVQWPHQRNGVGDK